MNDAVRFRTIAVLVLLLATAILNGLRLAVSGDQSFADEPIGAPLVMGVLMLYQAITLLWLFKGRDHQKPLPTPWIYLNATIESAAPTALAFAVGLTSGTSLHVALLGPASHMYAIFLVLSILHVRFAVSCVAGVVATSGFGAVVIVSLMTDDTQVSEVLGLARSLEGLSAIFVLLTGIAAGMVAMRMRTYLESAASEAERRMRAEHDLQAAALVQQSLMPSESPVIPGFEIVGWNRPADETGGDYFDWVPLEDGRFAVCIADVTGHGLGPAMITCFCRAYARTALRVENRIAAAVTRLNAELVNDLGDGRFVTFAAVVITPDSDHILSTSAGHGPLLIHRHRNGTVEGFGADGLPLGLDGVDVEVEAVSHELADGDAFVLLTDGFFEWANHAGQQFGIKRLETALAKHGRATGHGLIDGLLQEVEAFADGTPQPDDLTAVVIRRTTTRNNGSRTR
ncbi:MAG: PP2C family protein-serine/threonine phosphatase [Planctomycetota bacterium]